MIVVRFVAHAAARLAARAVPADLLGLALARPTWSGPAGNGRQAAELDLGGRTIRAVFDPNRAGERLFVVTAFECGGRCRRRRAA